MFAFAEHAGSCGASQLVPLALLTLGAWLMQEEIPEVGPERISHGRGGGTKGSHSRSLCG